MAEAVRVAASAGYALWAGTWDTTPSPVVAVEERLVRPWLAGLTPRRTLDVGCGTGRWTGRLAAIGFDASPEMLAVAAGKAGLRGRLAAADAAALPVADNCAELVLCALTLGHVPDWGAAMREFARVLKPGGSLVLTDFHPAAVERGWRRTFRHGEVLYEVEHYPYTITELEQACERLVLRRCEAGSIGEAERGLFAEAGRTELYEASRETPVVLLSEWIRA